MENNINQESINKLREIFNLDKVPKQYLEITEEQYEILKKHGMPLRIEDMKGKSIGIPVKVK